MIDGSSTIPNFFSDPTKGRAINGEKLLKGKKEVNNVLVVLELKATREFFHQAFVVVFSRVVDFLVRVPQNFNE